MDQGTAIQSIREELQKRDTDLNVFQSVESRGPDSIPVPSLIQTAKALGAAFLIGVASPDKDRASAWGKNIENWLCDEIETCFQSESSDDAIANELNTAIPNAKNAYQKMTPGERTVALDETESLLRQTLLQKKIIESRASAISAKVRSSMSSVIAEG